MSIFRPCYVKGFADEKEKALFHCFFVHAYAIAPVLVGQPGGQFSNLSACVEFEDGSVGYVSPDRIQFADNNCENYCWVDEDRY